jgi:hypothetical protein
MVTGALAASGSTDNVQLLLDRCKNRDKPMEQSFCIGYINGVGDMMGINGMLHVDPTPAAKLAEELIPFSMCSTEQNLPSVGAQVQAFVNWATKHPEKWTSEPYVGVISALRETWPCRSESGK